MRGSAAFRTGVAPGGALAGPWVRDPLWRTARAVPSLDLDFADNKSLVDRVTGQSLVTFTRASTGTYVGSDGLLKTAATNEPRFDHNPTTGESLGLLVEEARTNSIRNNTMVGAVAGTPGTLPINWSWNTAGGASTEVVGTGTENGIAYADVRLFGTLSSAASIQFDTNTAILAATGQAWTESFYCKTISLVSGTLDLRFRIVERSGAGSYLAEGNAAFTPGISSASLIASRFTFTRTLTNALTGCVVPAILFNQSSGAIDITIRIGLPQLEQGAFATSVIPTTGATATRAADVASITGSNFSSWYNQAEGTVFADVTVPSTAKANQTISFNDGTSNNRIELRPVGSASPLQMRTECSVSGVTKYSSSFNLAGDRRIAALAMKANDFRLQSGASGVTPVSDALPTVDRLYLNYATFAGGEINGTIKRLIYWGQRLPNNVLQAITQ